jgi:tetratricopeptide (TPR) repeat protein/transcriptional regulator with XRE-family HTH domain
MGSSRQLQHNILLRHQRLQRGWSMRQTANQLCKLCEEEEHIPGVTADMISKWERGEKKPSRYYQEKFCLLYGASADQLGFIDIQDVIGTTQANDASLVFSAPIVLAQPTVATLTIDARVRQGQAAPETLAANLLSVSSQQLATLTAAGWTLQDIITALHVVLQGETAMATLNRRRVLQLGAGLVLSGIPFPSHEHPSIEERSQLTQALGESIAASWKLFHTAGNAQILAVGQAQLYLVQQSHGNLYPSVRPMFYSAVYRLIGAALHFQGRYYEARQAHEKAYIAALEGADAWNMAQSLSWQAYGWRAQERYSDAVQATDAAFQLISEKQDTESIRLRARLLAFGAEIAALVSEEKQVQARLHASAELLEYLPGLHEEFDRASWLQQAGTCALTLGQHDLAAEQLRQALGELPPQWALRYVPTALSLVGALMHKGELDEALALARRTLPLVKAAQAPALTQEFSGYLQREVLAQYPNDTRCQTFVSETQRQLALA